MSNIADMIVGGLFGGGIITAFVTLLRTNLTQQRLFAEHMKDMLEATKAGARADYAVASALQRIEQRMGLDPSGAGSQSLPGPTPGQGGTS